MSRIEDVESGLFAAYDGDTEQGKSELDGLVMCDCYPDHCTHGETCWCEPQVEIINGNKVIIHNEPN